MFTDTGRFIPVNKAALESHYHSVRISGSRKSADDLFTQMQRFSQLNLYPVQARGDVSGRGGVVEWDMVNGLLDFGGHNREFWQGDFDVQVTKYDAVNRTFVARSLSRRPLAGWRLWRVREAGNDIILETFSVEHAATFWDTVKLHGGGLDGMYQTWTNMLGDLVDCSGGEVVYGSDTVLGGENSTNRVHQYLPLVE